MARVRIVKLPKALSGLEVKMQPGLYGTNGNTQFNRSAHLEAGKISQKPTEVRNTLQPVARGGANLEAERGETAVVNIDGIPAHFKIGGKRHSQGGTPLNLPDNSFIFSDTAKMKIKDPVVLAQFGMKPKRGGYTPADIAKKYDINKYRKVLADPNTEDIERKTAEMMIANYNEKLAKLALAQESVKGFPQGIPVMAMPYVESMKMDPASFLPDQAEEQLEGADEPDAEMGTSRYGSQVINQFPTKKYGGLPKAQTGYVGKGFSNDPVYEKEVAEDSDLGPYYRKFKEAIDSKDRRKMTDALAAMNKADITNSWQWIPWSKENKITDFAQILREEIGKIDVKNKPKTPTANAQDQALRKKASDTFAYVSYLKNKAKADKDSDKEIYYDDELKRLRKIHPNYKGAHFWRQEKRAKNAYSVPGSGEYVPPTSSVYYNQTEGDVINDYYNTYLNKESDKYYNKSAGVKQQNTTPLNQKPSTAQTDTTGLAEYNRLMGIKEYGGVPEYNGGGGVNKTKSAFPKVVYNDGSIYNSQTKKWEKDSDQPKADGKKSTTGTATSAADYDPYPGYTEDELAALLEDPSVLRKTKVAGKQKTGQAGTYGTGVSLDEFKARNPEYIKKFKDKYGRDFTEADAETFQKEYTQHVKDLAKKRALDAGYTDAEANEAAEKFAKSQGFYDGQLKSGDPRGIDKKFGEYTSSRFEPIFKKKAAAVVNKDEKQTNKDRGPIERNPPMNLGNKTYAPWWLQDIVKISGAAADQARINKYLPWQATPEVRLPDGTFYDPTRELAANAEQANIANQYAAAFTDPRRLAAAQAQTQGKALENAANIMGKYNTMNVQLANQLSQQDTSIMNQAAQNKANLDTMLYDKYTIANQQFDNAKAAARQNLRQSYIDAITNKAKTQALNTLYPNFYTDPSGGGYVQKTGLASINPTPGGSDELDQIEKIMQRFPGTSFKDAQAYLKGGKGSSDNSDMSDYVKAQGYT